MLDAQTKEHAHDLIDRMAPGQLSAVVGLMEILLDPVARSLANAPWEDEEIDKEEELAVAESKAWVNDHPGHCISHKEVLAEYGLTGEGFERIGHTSLATNGPEH